MWKEVNRIENGSTASLTVEDDDPAVAAAGLGVVAKANVVTLHARRLAMVPLVHFVATETGVPRLHAGELQEKKKKKKRSYANERISNSKQTLGNASHDANDDKSIWHIGLRDKLCGGNFGTFGIFSGNNLVE